MRTIIMTAGQYGDVTITWEEHNDAVVLPAIQNMIDQRYIFFVMAAPDSVDEEPLQIRVTKTRQAAKTRHIVLPDVTLEELHEAGRVSAAKVALIDSLSNTGEIARTAEEVAAADATVTVAPAGGG